MSVYVEYVSQVRPLVFTTPHVDTMQHVEVVTEVHATEASQLLVNPHVAELIESPLMKKEIINRNHEKMNDALGVLQAIYSSDFLNDHPTKNDLATLLKYLERARAQLENGIEANIKFAQSFALDIDVIGEREFEATMLAAVEAMSEEQKKKIINEIRSIDSKQIAPDKTPDHIIDDGIIIDELNNFVEYLTDTFLKYYQDAASVSTEIYTAFAALNVSISEMISGAEVDADENTITLDVTVLKQAIADLRTNLTKTQTGVDEEGNALPPSIFDQLSVIEIPDRAIAEELALGAGLVVTGTSAPYGLAVDETALENLEKAFKSLTTTNNTVGGNPNKIKVPSGTLQAFQTAVESVNNTVSSDNQTLVERLRSVTNQQQQTTQLFSSLLKEIIAANKEFITKISS